MSIIKRRYKFLTVLSMFILCLIISIYIYACYDKDNRIDEITTGNIEEPAKLAEDNTVIPEEDNILVVYFKDEEETDEPKEIITVAEANRQTFVNSEGIQYFVDATLVIPKIGLNYPVLSETSDKLLEHNLNKFWGPKPNTVGNYVIVGHNYNNKTYFGKLDQLKNGDIIELTDVNGKTVKYKVYDMYYVDPSHRDCTSQLTDGKREVTLITCNATGSQRLVVKTTEVV